MAVLSDQGMEHKKAVYLILCHRLEIVLIFVHVEEQLRIQMPLLRIRQEQEQERPVRMPQTLSEQAVQKVKQLQEVLQIHQKLLKVYIYKYTCMLVCSTIIIDSKVRNLIIEKI
jgi:hypothetical protein